MFVRTAGERDLKAVRELLVETWHATYDDIYGVAKVTEITDDWHSIASLRARLEKPRSEFVLADDGKTIAGMAFATNVDDGKTVMLHQLYVRPAMQGRGVGGLLLDEIENAFPEADKVRLEVEEKNAKAVAFYIGQGFSEIGRTENCGKDQSGIPALIFERPIVWAD
ncbi:MAG: GNAT family N-acetyltransferase [Rhizobiaceae bacterium]|nr:GNAT family N-acetyltransferase [Rhizobiaceae bacterium]